MTGSSVISSRLVTFRTLTELVEQNRRLLALSRQLSADCERTRAELRAELASEWAAREAHLRQVCARVSQRLLDYFNYMFLASSCASNVMFVQAVAGGGAC